MDKIANALSRRRFTQMLSAGAAIAALRPTAFGPTAPASLPAFPASTVAHGVVRLSSNENPYGPSPAALKAMTEAFGLACRYPDEHADALIEDLAKLHNVPRDHILLGDGSSEILNLCAMAFTGPDKNVVVADPTFEAIVHHARVSRAEAVKIRLTADYRHDLPRMVAAAGSAGLIYICNPNNPTASITPKAEMRAFLAQSPRQTVLLVDEAYHHYADNSDYESVIPQVKDYSNLIVTRTFSKIYGMAGLRCGYCVAQPGLIQRLQTHQAFDSVNIMALAAARASLNNAGHLEQGRRLNREVKEYVCSELDKLGYRYIPSAANFLMIDLRREVQPVIGEMRLHNVEVGRFFPPLPNFMRVTIGTKPEMQTFLSVFRQVMGNPALSSHTFRPLRSHRAMRHT